MSKARSALDGSLYDDLELVEGFGEVVPTFDVLFGLIYPLDIGEVSPIFEFLLIDEVASFLIRVVLRELLLFL